MYKISQIYCQLKVCCSAYFVRSVNTHAGILSTVRRRTILLYLSIKLLFYVRLWCLKFIYNLMNGEMMNQNYFVGTCLSPAVSSTRVLGSSFAITSMTVVAAGSFNGFTIPCAI
jgi:hypothetical protein